MNDNLNSKEVTKDKVTTNTLEEFINTKNCKSRDGFKHILIKNNWAESIHYIEAIDTTIIKLKDGIPQGIIAYLLDFSANNIEDAKIIYQHQQQSFQIEPKNGSNGPLFLHENEIEDGGPQPRLAIKPDDPETVALFESIKAVGQHDPIAVYPSPIAAGKYRICEGHRRLMVIFSMLHKDGILALNKNRTEQEAYADALILNNKKGLTVMDKAHYYKDMMEKFPISYPTLESIGKIDGATKQEISLIMLAYEEIMAQKPKLSAKASTMVDKLPERSIREIRKKIPEQFKPTVYEAAAKIQAESKTPHKDIKALVNAVRNNPNPTEATVEEKVAMLIEEADYAEKKEQRIHNKLIKNTVAHVPKELIDEIIARSNNGEKLTVENLGSYGAACFAVAYQILKEHNLIDKMFEEANKW